MSGRIILSAGATLISLACLAASAQATPVTITTPFMNLENRGINSLGFTPGQFMRIGANSVVPNGLAGTTGVGTTIDRASGELITRTINFNPGPIIPNFFSRGLTNDPNRYGPWTMTFSNGADNAVAVVSLPDATTQAPFVNSITLSGTSERPIFTWTPPPGAAVNGYRINIHDKALVGPGNNGQVTSRNLQPGITSYEVTPADFTVPGYGFQLGHHYVIEIGLIQTRDGLSNNLGNANLKAISRYYADFTPQVGGGPVVNLPVVLADGTYQFNMTVVAGTTYYIDPAVAIGYDYAIGDGDPLFASVSLPNIGDGLFDIFGFDAQGNLVLLADDWHAGDWFSFAGNGITRFRVAGIEVSAGLDPANTTAFITGLTFAGSGHFTGTQTPLTVNVELPEPPAWALAGLAGVLLIRRARRRA